MYLGFHKVSLLFRPILTTREFCRQILMKLPKQIFTIISWTGDGVFCADGLTDRHDETNGVWLFSRFFAPI